jgi:uncharacterized membrane protein
MRYKIKLFTSLWNTAIHNPGLILFFLTLLFLISSNLTPEYAASSSARFGFQGEKILSYHSDITAHKNGSVLIEETIKVYAAGDRIKRGIFRDFPTTYKDDNGNTVKVGFVIKKILRDGRTEDYHTEYISNGVRIYIGNKNVFLEPGYYTYSIIYETTRQIGFFKDHDELYWNVTGNGWDFPIESASATIMLPGNFTSDNVKYYGYTGAQGSRKHFLKSLIISSDKIEYKTTRPLGSREGLTIVAEFPKGFVDEPTQLENVGYFINDNIIFLIGAAGILILFFYYLIIWARVGKDPKEGTIFPEYTPPDKFSPSAVRYIHRMSYDNKTFSAAVINMAVKGFLTIREVKKDYTIVRGKADISVLTPEEKKIASEFNFNNSTSEGYEFELKQSNHVSIRSAIDSLRRSLKNTYEKIYFITNKKFFIVGVLISLVILFLCGISLSPDQIGIFLWLSIWSAGVIVLLFTAFKTWHQAFAGGRIRFAAAGSAIFISLFALPFIGGEVIGLYFFSDSGSIGIASIVLIIALINIIFYHLLKAPTLLGRKLLDKIEGFKMYLSAAEKERLNILTPPDKTPELFEKYLPYALALDVEQKWSEQFSSVLSKVSAEGTSYSPAWYSGAAWSGFSAGSFASSFNSSFSSAISSSSTAPGSSSGGGGFSGGGGGGGGGGGW